MATDKKLIFLMITIQVQLFCAVALLIAHQGWYLWAFVFVVINFSLLSYAHYLWRKG